MNSDNEDFRPDINGRRVKFDEIVGLEKKAPIEFSPTKNSCLSFLYSDLLFAFFYCIFRYRWKMELDLSVCPENKPNYLLIDSCFKLFVFLRYILHTLTVYKLIN